MLNDPCPKPRLWFALWAVIVIAQVLLYANAWAILPAGDDWTAPVSEIGRAHRDGIWKVLTVNAWQHPMYRPLQSLVFIALAKLPGPLWPWVTVLNQLCFAIATAVLLGWAYTFRLPLKAAAAAALVFAVHPLNVAAVASVDGFGSVLTPSLAWGIALLVYLLRGRPALALTLATFAMTVVSGVKEYVFAAVPMSLIIVLFTYRNRWKSAVVYALVMGSAVAVNLYCRRYLTALDPGYATNSSTAHVSPVALVANLIGGLAVGLYPGNTVTVFTPGSLLVRFGPVAIGISAVTILLTVGLWKATSLFKTAPHEHAEFPSGVSPRAWIAALVLLTAASMFPACVAKRMSEMYLLGISFGIALLTGYAAVGFHPLRTPFARRLLPIAFGLILGFAIFGLHAKANEQALSGRLSYTMAEQLNRELPPARVKLAILFNPDELRKIGYYSVYRLPRNGLVVHETLHYFRPGLGDTVECIIPDPNTAPELSSFDVVYNARVPDLTRVELIRMR